VSGCETSLATCAMGRLGGVIRISTSVRPGVGEFGFGFEALSDELIGRFASSDGVVSIEDIPHHPRRIGPALVENWPV
jgi:hypothetical protein